MGQNRRTQAIQECAGKQEPPIDEHLTDAERKYRRQPREWVAEFVKAGLPEDFIDRQVRLLKRGKNDFPYGWACYAQMKPLKLFPVSIIYLALNARLEYSNVTYQETCKCCEQIVYWGGARRYQAQTLSSPKTIVRSSRNYIFQPFFKQYM